MPAELLGSQKMRDLISTLRLRYDFVIIDTPPVLTVTDASVVGAISDGVLLVLRYGTSKHDTIIRSIESLLRNGAQIMGAVVNAVDQKSVDYSAYYGSSYNNYFDNDAPK
jgi:Mrp family chromosome partitioning ATPase